MFDVYEIRKDFPLIMRGYKGKRIVFLDNTASTQKPRQVIEKIKELYECCYANIHRGLYDLSLDISEQYEEAHKKVARFINARSWEEIIFVRNATEAINLVAYAWGLRNLRRGDEIVISIMEHHSNIVPWYLISQLTGAEIKVVDITDEGKLRYDMLEELITERTKIVSILHASNVLGTINDVERIAKIAHKNGALFLVDGAQSVPHLKVDVQKIDADFLAFSGHKMLGPPVGVLYGKKEILEEMSPFLGGGDMISDVVYKEGRFEITWNKLPWKFEAGTPAIVEGIALGTAVEYLERLGMDNVREHEVRLTKFAMELLEGLDRIRIYGPKRAEERVGVIAFSVEGARPEIIAMMLNEYGICVRSGMHCAHPLHRRLGIKDGTVRMSFYIYNTEEEIEYAYKALSEILRRV